MNPDPASNSNDVLAGWKFSADLSLSTPLRSLEHDGEIRASGQPPPKSGEYANGCWVPVTKSWEELGLGDLFKEGDSSLLLHESEMGPVSETEKAAILAFLVGYRRIVESMIPERERCASLREYLALPAHAQIVSRMGDPRPEDPGIVALATKLGIGPALAERLYSAGFVDSAEVRQASDEQLLAVHGVGRRRLALLRRSMQPNC